MDPKLQRRVQRYGWDKAVEHYEAHWRSQLEPAQAKLLEMAAIAPGERILDVACGTGLVTFPAAEAAGPKGYVLGTDISEKMVEAAKVLASRNETGQVEFRRMDAEDLTVETETFDLALCSLGLMYFPDPVSALKQMLSALNPGGRAVASVWGQRDRCGWAEIFPIVDFRVNSEVCPLFFQLGTGNALAKTFEMAGFTNVSEARIETILEYEGAEDAIGAAFAGGPVALAYSKFDEATRREAHDEYLASIAAFEKEGRYGIPGEFVIVRGHRG